MADAYLNKRLNTGRSWPQTWEERHAEYDRREASYRGLAYTEGDVKALGLFQYADSNGNVVQSTRRVFQMIPFVIDTDAAALSAGLTLNLDPVWAEDTYPGGETDADALSDLEAGARVWRNSDVRQRAHRWATMLSTFGDLHLEASLVDGDGIVAAHRPQHVKLWYDRMELDLSEARIEFEYEAAPEDDSGTPTTIRYERALSVDSVRWREDGRTWTETPNRLGAVPLVHVQFASDGDPHFGRHAAAGIEDPVAMLDSMATQMQVIGTRTANPILVLIGAAFDGGVDTGGGTGLSLPSPESSIQWLEPALQGLQAMAGAEESLRVATEKAVPEMLFAEAGAQASGAALTARSARFVAKITPVQRRFHDAIAQATSMAVALERGIPLDEAPRYEVTGAPALPEDRASLADLLVGLRNEGAITERDLTAALQRLELVAADEEPVSYGVAALADMQARARAAADLLSRSMPQDEPDEVDDVGEDGA